MLVDKDTCPRPEKHPGLQVRNENNFHVPLRISFLLVRFDFWDELYFSVMTNFCLCPQDGHGDFYESPQQDSWSFPADFRPGRDLHLQSHWLAAVPSGTEYSLCFPLQLSYYITQSLWSFPLCQRVHPLVNFIHTPTPNTNHLSSLFYLPHLLWSLSKRGHKGKDELDFIFYQIFCTGHATLISTTLSGSGQLPEAGCVLCI